MEIYWAVLYEYIQTLLIDESWLEFFIEGTRSRYGKTLAPKLGILNMVCDTVFDNKISNANILPITMSYERVIEGEAYPLELLGEEKKKESLGRLIGALNILTMNFGRVYVEFCDTISIKQYAEDFMEKSEHTKNPYTNLKDREALVQNLGFEIVYRLNENLIIMPTSIVSSLLLLHRKGISEEMLMQKVEWLKNQILERGGRIGGIDENSSLKTIKGAITHLQHLVEQKKDIVHLQVSAKSDYKNVLMLAYYRNMLLQVFWHECLVACSLSSFGQEIAWKEGLSAERLWEELSFLAELMSREFHLRTPITKANYMSLINAMVDRKILSYKDNKIKVVDDLMMAYLCNLIWPFIESYWVCSVYMFSLKNRTTPTYEKKFSQEVQMFTESMYEERIIEFYEACSIDTIKNAVSIFKKWKLLNSNKKMLEKGLSEPSIELAITEDALNLVQDHIRRFLKNSFAKSVNSPIELARKTMLIDYPFMAKM